MEHKKVFSVMKSLITTIIVSLLGVLCAAYGGNKAGDCVEYNAKKEMVDDIQLDECGWIARVNRNKVFDVLKIYNPISTRKWHFTDEDSDGEKHYLYPLEGVRVHCLNIHGNEISRKLNGNKFETISLHGIEDLQRLVINGKIPQFEESRERYHVKKDTSWRRNLSTIEFVDSVSITSIPFLQDIKCVVLGTNTVGDILKWGEDGRWDELSKCYALEELVVPYSLATNTLIEWGEIIKNSALKEREVLSFERSEDGETGNVALLNMAMNGVISDCVTTIRGDAIRGKAGQRIYMPFNVTNIIKGPIPSGVRLTLKKNGVLLYPDLFGDKKSIEESRSFKKFYPVSITTAYCGLILTNSVGGKSSDLHQEGLSYISSILLRRGERSDLQLNNSISAMLRLGSDEYPVWITPSKGAPEERINIKFKAGVSGASKFKLLIWSLIAFVVVYGVTMLVRRWLCKDESFDAIRCIGAAVGIGVGILIFVLGLECAGVLQYYVDTYLTGKVMSYLNASFISSLVISVSTTLLKLAVGFLQGIKVSAIFAGYDMNAVLQPVQDILEKISTYSWISTCVLAFMRMVCQVLKDGAGFIWPVVGTSATALISFSYCQSDKPPLRLIKKWLHCVFAIGLLLMIGLPVVLYGCAWVSSQFSNIAGSTFDAAMSNFTAVAKSFSMDTLKTVTGIRVMMEQLVDAVSSLTSAAMYYIATKAFDCFAVPLLLYLLCKKIMSKLMEKDNGSAVLTKAVMPKVQSNARWEQWIESLNKNPKKVMRCSGMIGCVMILAIWLAFAG